MRSVDGNSCLIAVANKSGSDTLSAVWVTIYNSGEERLRIGPADLAPGQAIVLKDKVEATTICDGPGVFYQVSYRRAGVHNQTMVSNQFASSTTLTNTLTGAIVGGLIAFLSAIAGAWLNHGLTLARERRNARKDKFGRMETLFNSFFVGWGGSIVPQELQARFNELQGHASLDQEVVDHYREVYQTLVDNQITNEQKQEEAVRFEQGLREYLRNLDPDADRA